MKKIISLLLTILIILVCTYPAFADPDNSEETNLIVPVTVVDDLTEDASSYMLRGTNIPSETVSLLNGVTYSGSATFSTMIYTNYLFSNHGGTIKISLHNSTYGTPVSGDVVNVDICKKGLLGIGMTVVETKTAPLNGAAILTFSGLNTSTSYFFRFWKSHNSYDVDTYFTIWRG